ncbi:hypothetical protein POM88_021892 [Heracleum sosnowskyi]|uniref:Uncharacterized protein n=1 Tax=Heracleum sosnowskyi TaxID=360622 RepID=A0AAD8IDZ9_9APIA|nr:hypothetical protein POM88_021892 [Heracleum sosnowskyi]
MFYRFYDGELKVKHPGITDKDIESIRAKEFAHWIKDKALAVESTIPGNVLALAMGPNRDQVSCNGYKVNGYDFHTKAYGLSKKTTNSDWKVVIHTPARRREEVVDGDIYQEQMLHRPDVINVDEGEIIQLDGGDDPQEMDHALVLVLDNEEEEELLTDTDTESENEEDDGYESGRENDSESDNDT